MYAFTLYFLLIHGTNPNSEVCPQTAGKPVVPGQDK